MSQDLPAQFITSPYADTFVKVLLKGNSITWIHRGVIPVHVLYMNNRAEVVGSKSASPIVDMQNIGNDTAHVIIHFFYTKKYNCVKPSGLSGDAAKAYELRLSLQVIEAARKMKLPALVDLAKKDCARFYHEMDFFNLVAILGKMNVDTKHFPELAQYISLHIEKVLSDPHSQLASNLLSRNTSNSITEMIFRKLVLKARGKPTGEPKGRPEPGNETRDIPMGTQLPSHDSMPEMPEPSQFTQQRRSQKYQEVLKTPQPDDKGKGRAVSNPTTYVSKLHEKTVPHHESRAANRQEEAQSRPSRVRDWPCPFSPPCGGSADPEKKANPPTPGLAGCIASMKDFVAVEKSSAVDWEVPKSETEKSEKSESERTECTVVDSDDEGVLVESETQATTTPSTEDSRNANRMNLFYAYDRW
ncbi:hypothetical protein FVER14953_10172 [Fusarium verticillioides]|nr:hypothetical protein FVER14953_10172 [Fusarium verticillioides]